MPFDRHISKQRSGTTASLVVSWRPFDRAAFGTIYSAIMVLSILMALEREPTAPFRPAIVLFGSILAMTLARSFAALISHAIETGERMMTPPALQRAWAGSQSTFAVVLLPTALFTAVGIDSLKLQTAVLVSQLYCILILVVFGGRVGWVVGRDIWLPIIGATCAGALGFALAALKYAMQ